MKNTVSELTNPLSSEMLYLEKNIAYFFGVENPDKVSCHYIKAVQEIERLGKNESRDILYMHLISHLRLAYQEVSEQKQLRFNIDKAAELEFELFMGGLRNSTFEKDFQILVKIYETVFQTSSNRMLKAAMLRSFLFKYKIAVFDETQKLTPSDQDILLELAKASEDEMMSFENELIKEEM
jgi:hypothetical protein